MRVDRPVAYRWVGAEAIVLLLGSALFAAGYWWTHPTVLAQGGQEGESLTVGQTHVISVVDHLSGVDETVKVLDIAPRVVRDETAARFGFLTCVLKDANGGLGSGDEGDIADFCATTGPTARRTFGQDGRRSQILMTVTATRPGRLTIDGADVTYRRSGRHLFQTGTQAAGSLVEMTAR